MGIEMNSLSASLSLCLISFVPAVDANADFELAAGGPDFLMFSPLEKTSAR